MSVLRSSTPLARALIARQVAQSTARLTAVTAPSVVHSARHCPTVLRNFTSSPVAFRRALEAKWAKSEPVAYDELKPITQSPDDSVLLIDVREPAEVALGSIPSSVNLPLTGFEKSLNMDEGDFTRTHGFHKPTKVQPIIFYCKAGVRAETAVDLARRAGYKAVRNYRGSYDDWVKREQKAGYAQDD